MNWTIDRWSDAKTYAKFCLPDKKESHSCIGLWQVMKSGSIFRILKGFFRKKSWVGPAQPSTSFSRPNRFGRKTMLCVWWDQEGVIYYELLKPGGTINAHRYYQQLIKLHLCVKKGRIIGKDMTSWFSSMTTRQQWSKTTWRHSTKKCYHTAYSPDLTPSDYHLFSSMDYALAERHFDSYEDEKGLIEWFASKDEEFFWRGIHKLPERWEKCIISEDTLNKFVFFVGKKKYVFLTKKQRI